MVNTDDIIYRWCKVGRYTYGYEKLLEAYSMANIGRYCSINGTARIWNNHSLDCISTHPFWIIQGCSLGRNIERECIM